MPSSSLSRGSIVARTWGAPDAPTVLCWHGAGGSSLDFEPVAVDLAERHGLHVVAIDGPGHAQSALRPAEAFSPSALAALAVELLDELAVERTVFLGFSWGASVGCRLAAQHPDRVLALALVEGGHLDFADVPGFRTDRTLDELVSEAEADASRDGSPFDNYSPATAAAMVYGLCQEPVTTTYERLAASGVPVLFVAAQQDGQLSSFALERLSRLVPQTRIVRLQSASHDVLQAAPDDVAREVGAWLAELPLA
jgi:pimeloyl-ACP methyl ester carboxylesterase